MTKKDKKIDINRDGTIYKQIRTEGNDTTWKNVPKVESDVLASGLHIISGKTERNHYDYYIGKKKLEGVKESTQERLSGILLKIGKGNFAVPPNKIIVLTGENGIPTFISYENYQKNYEKFRIVLKNNHGQPCVIATL